jgi:hypothetical protein
MTGPYQLSFNLHDAGISCENSNGYDILLEMVPCAFPCHVSHTSFGWICTQQTHAHTHTHAHAHASAYDYAYASLPV